MRCIIVHYHEIALKGKNRPTFVRQLVENLERATEGLGVEEVRPLTGRVMMRLDESADWPSIKERLGRVFGVANFSLAFRTPLNINILKERIAQELEGISFNSFRVRARRAYKAFPLTSQEIEREVGAYVKEMSGAKVDLTGAELTIFIEVVPVEAFFYFEKIPGPGGLPVGVAGRVVSLISGGIDSPVAAYRMMKRGCQVIFVHLHAYPFLDKTSQDKVRELVRLLNRHQYTSRLYLIPFGEVQRRVTLSVKGPYRVVIYRRLMGRIAERIARREGAGALVTGESLGQVASQTMENLSVIEEAVTIPIFRPLIGMDKSEISKEAQDIGTYDISIIPDQDCCQLFVPSNPATYTSVEEIRRAEEGLDMEGLIDLALEGSEVVDL